MNESLSSVSDGFAVPGYSLIEGPGGLPVVSLVNDHGVASIALQGATVLSYRPSDEADVLYVSESAVFSDGQPIRGGVPICFPWFGSHGTDAGKPSHGTVRTRAWELVGVHEHNGALTVRLTTREGVLAVAFEVTLGPRLGMSLEVEHTGRSGESEVFEAALHTYLSVGDVSGATVTGLEQTDYLDQLEGRRRLTQGDDPIVFEGEVDRIYLNTSATCVLHDPVFERSVAVDKDGSRSTVVWNPWIEKARRLADLPDDAWQRFVCIETGNIADNAVTLRAGERHRMAAALSVQ
ncbi:D-hexose-6-phosphate mutarotase [Mucisphaera calidilacus]|nr:D-hexose-6-phosphate mutarotase [Mucisphaera calidilacus]